MVVSDLLLQGVNLMFLGMGIVFTFLAILVVALTGMSRLAASLSGPEAPPTATAAAGAATDDSELIAVISAAINRYRSKQ